MLKLTLQDGFVSEAKLVEFPKTKLLTGQATCVFIDEDKDSLLVTSFSEAWIYNTSDGSISELPRPAELGEDLNVEWAINGLLCFPGRNELWVGTSQAGILICDLKALLASAKPVSVIDYEPLLPVLLQSKIYPLPSQGYSNIEIYQQLGTTNELEGSVYDISGNKMERVEIEISTIVGMKKRVKIITSNLPKGIYIAQIKYKEHELSAKFIVE